MSCKIAVSSIKEVELFPSDLGPCQAKVVEMGNVVGVTYFQKPVFGVGNSLMMIRLVPVLDDVGKPVLSPKTGLPLRKEELISRIQRLSADTYLDRLTNEVKEYKKSENRAESLQSLKRTFARLRALINTNVTTPENVRWVTLTYAENMQDRQRLYKDFEKFWKRFLYYCKTHGIGKPEYIAVVEPQGRGAWHVHLLIIWDGPAPYLHNDTVFSPLWGHGYTKIKAVRNDCDNVGAYFTAYLADIPVDDLNSFSGSEKNVALFNACEVVEKTVLEHGVKRKKAIIKGGRLNMYPSGMNLYRASRGLKKPEITWLDSEGVKEKVQSANCTFRRGYEIKFINDESGKEETVNIIIKEYYNKKLSDCQEVFSENTDDSAFYDMRVSAELIASLIKDS